MYSSLYKVLCILSLLLCLAPAVYGEKDSKSGVRPQVISLPGGPGAIEGLGESFETRLNTGSGQYPISLKVMPGRAGFAPSLTLSYDGGNGNGIVGMGWKLPLMSVRRQSDKGLPRYTFADTFITESGEELIRVEGTDTDNVQVFRQKNESSFSRYEYFRAKDQWICTDKSGQRYFLGSRADSTDVSARIRHPEKGKTYSWHMAEAADTNGNRVIYTYNADQGQVYCSLIEYGALETNDSNARHRIEFVYENRPDPIADYRSGFRMVTARRLKQIDMKSSGNPVRSYRLEYLAGNPLSLLSRLILAGKDGTSQLPPAEFRYTSAIPAENAQLIPLSGLDGASLLLSAQNPDDYPGACELLDFNGDALPDMYQSRHPGSDPFTYDIVFENQGNGIFLKKNLSQTESLNLKIQSENSFVQDVNGDGLADLVAQKGTNPEDFVWRANLGGKWAVSDIPFSFPVNLTAQDVFKNPEIRASDLNGDKQTDTLRSYTTVTALGQGVVFEAFLSRTDGTFEQIPQTTEDIVKGLPVTFTESGGSLVLADMNGDRLQDLVLIRDASNGGPVCWYAKGFGQFDDSAYGYEIPLTQGPDFGGDPEQVRQLELDDLNGDGLADLYLISGAYIRYWLNQGGQSFGSERSIDMGLQFDPNAAAWRLTDVDGDGLQEILFYVQTRPTPDYLPQGFSYVRLFRNNRDRVSDNTDNDGDGLTDEADEGNTGPNLLCEIRNGIGKTTSLLYSSHVEDMIRDQQAGTPWTTLVPFPMPVLRQTDEYDGQNNYQKKLSFHDGYYDGKEKEFRGFARAESCAVGDDSAPDLVQAYVYDTGRTQEALKGRPLTMETRDASGAVFFRENHTWEVRKLADANDGTSRSMMFAYARMKTRDVLEKGRGTPVQLKWEYEYDNYGNMTRQYEHGRSDSGWDDERITEISYSAGFASGLSLWILDKVVSQSVKDENSIPAGQKRNYYDGSTVLGQIIRGNITQTEDWVSGSLWVNSVRRDYDSFGNVTAIYDGLYGSSPGHFREVVYDDLFHIFPVQEIIHTGNPDMPSLEMHAAYDFGMGTVVSSTDFNGFTTTYGYDSFGRLISVSKPPDTDHTVEYDYVLSHSLPDGKIINWVETRRRDGSADGFLISREFYDGMGRKIMTRSEGEESGQVVVSDTVMHNARQLPRKKYLPYFETGTLTYSAPLFNTGFTEHFYDAAGREIRMNQPAGPDGIVFSQITYEPLVRFVQDEEQANPASPHSGCGMRYAEDGLLDKDGKGRLREVYEIVKLSDAGETAGLTQWKTAYQYNLLDQLTKITDTKNNQKIMSYDGLGRKIFMNDPDRGKMFYEYDAAGNLIRTTDAKNQVIRYEYEGVNRLSAEYHGADKTETDVKYHYDLPAGPVSLGDLWNSGTALHTRIADAVLKEIWNPEYDLNGDGKLDVADAVKAARSAAATETKTGRNMKGFLSWVEDQSGEEYNSYDERGRVEWVIKGIRSSAGLKHYFTGMDYDSLDRVTKLTYPDRSWLNYAYNSRGLMESLPGVVDAYDYNPSGQNALLNLSCGVSTAYTYDHRLRLGEMKTVRDKDQLHLQHMRYAYDRVSNITAITDSRTDAALTAIGAELGLDAVQSRKYNISQSFAYDSLYRLTQAANPSVYGTISYRYDSIGNMISKNAALAVPDSLMDLGTMTSGGSAGTSGRIGRNAGDAPGPHAITATAKGPDGPMSFAYDDNGNMVSDRDMTIAWDFRDRIAGISKSSGTALYSYDYTDTRKRKMNTDSQTGTQTETVYIDKYSEVRDGKLLKYAYAGTARIARSSIAGKGSAAFEPSEFYLHDHLGTTSLSLSATAQVQEQMVSYPYGHTRLERRAADSLAGADYTFTGKEQDAESGLHYFEARYYNPIIGKFISVDPILEPLNQYHSDFLKKILVNPQEINIYSYVLSNPVRYKDPSGYGAWPTTSTIIRDGGATGYVGYYGDSRINKDGSPKFHSGVDISGKQGDSISSFEGGTVHASGDFNDGYGNKVVIRHEREVNGKKEVYYSVYAHLKEIAVKKGEFVTEGQKIGTMGNSGNATDTPTHLHFEIRIGEDYLKAQKVDPGSQFTLQDEIRHYLNSLSSGNTPGFIPETNYRSMLLPVCSDQK